MLIEKSQPGTACYYHEIIINMNYDNIQGFNQWFPDLIWSKKCKWNFGFLTFFLIPEKHHKKVFDRWGVGRFLGWLISDDMWKHFFFVFIWK